MLYKNLTRNRNVINVAHVEESTEKEAAWELGNIIGIRGSANIMMPLQSEQNYSSGSYKKSASSVRNYLFFDVADNKKYWLFPNNDFLIAKINQLHSVPHGDQTKDTAAILYYVVTSDTNSDKLLTAADLQTVAISKPNGTQYTELLSKVDSIVGHKVISDNVLAIIFERKKMAYSAIINLKEFSVSADEPLPSVLP